MIGYCFHNTLYVAFPENPILATAYYVPYFSFQYTVHSQKNLTAFPRLDNEKRPQLKTLFLLFAWQMIMLRTIPI